MKFNTKTIHGGQIKEKGYGAVMPPIYQTSTYSQTKPGEHKGYEYSRTHNPTRTALENSLASIENGKHGLAFSSGLSAIDAVLKLFEPGDEIISTNDLYGGSYRLFDKVFKKFGLKFIFSDLQDIEEVSGLITNKTKMIWVETPTNPMMNLIDVQSLSNICRKNKVLLAVDNTFATPYLQKPLDLGADIVMHSATKYLAGHSDVILGALIVVFAKNPVHNAMGLVLTLTSLAILYITLNATFVAMVQMLVYAGAVMTLFLFVIMMIGVDKPEQTKEQIKGQKLLISGTLILLVSIVVFIGLQNGLNWNLLFPQSEITKQHSMHQTQSQLILTLS